MDELSPQSDAEAGSGVAAPLQEAKSTAGESATAVLLPDEATIEVKIAELSRLKSLQYERRRVEAAAELGLLVGALDRLVKEARRHPNNAAVAPWAGCPIEFPQIEQWEEAVSGHGLLDELSRCIREYLILTAQQADSVALWAVYTHAYDAFETSPKLIVKSPQKRSGKTRLIEVMERIVARPLVASRITPSALLRTIEQYAPTVLLDEMDAAMRANKEAAEALRGLLNSGFTRAGARHIMNVPIAAGGYEPRAFSTWAPQLLSGIGNLPDTVRDRAIEIAMKRKLPTESVRRLRRRDGQDLNVLARKADRWTSDILGDLRQAMPVSPKGLSDRACDVWEPLLAIADLAGGVWPERAREAARTLSGASAVEDENIGSILLADIQGVFQRNGVDRLSSEDLAGGLNRLDERPWSEWRGGKAITKFQLSRLLKDYEIISKTVRLDDGRTPKGYHLEDFADAFQRYVPSKLTSQLATSPQPAEIGPFEENSISPHSSSRCELRNEGFASETATCGDVATSDLIWSRDGKTKATNGLGGRHDVDDAET